MGKKTQVYEYHREHGNLVDYSGFELPVWFEGIIPECKTVRMNAGIFDVSHMGRVIVEGPQAEPFLNRLTTNDVSALAVGRGQYTLLCNQNGGIIDDLTIFKLASAKFLVVYNAANRDKDWNWLRRHGKSLEVKLEDVSDNVAMFAVQGPRAGGLLRKVSGLSLNDIEKYGTAETAVGSASCLITRSGYTGEDGFEIYVWNTSVRDPEKAIDVWQRFLAEGREVGLRPTGLGARDVLRLEAGMCLYGNEIDEDTSPVEARLGWVLKVEKDGFLGKDAILELKQAGPGRVRVGFKMLGKGIPRQGLEIRSDLEPIGSVTSGTLSPTLRVGIGMGYIKPQYAGVGEKLVIKIRDREVVAEVVKLPFYQRRSEDRVAVFGEEMRLDDLRTKLG